MNQPSGLIKGGAELFRVLRRRIIEYFWSLPLLLIMSDTLLTKFVGFVVFVRTDGSESIANGASINCLRGRTDLMDTVDYDVVVSERQLQVRNVHVGLVLMRVRMDFGPIVILCQFGFEPVDERLVVGG